MRRVLPLLFALPLLAVAAPIPKETDAQKLARLYGLPVDPAKDCKFTLDGDKLTITAGKGDHDLSVQSNEMNAPRVLKEIEGDFEVTVTVSGPYPKGAKGASEKRTIVFYGSGILVWDDTNNYVRLEKAYVDGLNGTPINCYGSWELFAGGEWRRRGSNADFVFDPTDTAYLKLSRKGSVFSASLSKDGKEWKELDPIEAEMGKKLKVGVAAVHICDTGFDAVFENYQLKATKIKEEKVEEKKEEKKDK
jgi:regulation of enolase protein 1 (concanavalin A-like superfamily)